MPPRLEALEGRELLSGASAIWNFASAPKLRPMKVNVLKLQPGASIDPVFVAPYGQSPDPSILVGQTGPLIMDGSGNPIWFKPASDNNSVQVVDFRTQTLFGKPVLTWWQGQIAGIVKSNAPPGTSAGGRFVIYNQRYQPIMTVSPPGSSSTDLHELTITPRGTAYFITTRVVKADLTPYGGLKNGSYVDTVIQEIDLRTGRRVFAWDMAAHVPLGDGIVPVPTTPGQAWDPHHVNSIDVSPDGSRFLISARNTWGIYEVSRQSGQVLWQVGGKQSQFSMPSDLITGPYNSAFQYQHDARYVPGGISLYDNAGIGGPPNGGPFGPARGLILNLDFQTHTASLAKPPYYHDPALISNSQGNFQVLPNGEALVGWGSETLPGGKLASYYTKYASDGSVIADYSLAGQNVSYRAFTLPWVGLPLTRPSLGVAASNGGATVYASWNGSTETASWVVLAGATRGSMVPVSATPRDGFETTIAVASPGPFFQVRALDAAGNVLSTSGLVRLRS